MGTRIVFETNDQEGITSRALREVYVMITASRNGTLLAISTHE